ncbi:MAG: DUF1284 domain-containing protein [Alphaproteobacteria bacterium]|jgi:hypothetical protein|nr:DUF1284 domain-containing protein [Candidatus Jidaibacter sp.]
MSDKTVKFRPHHFLCTLGFQGEGYSSEFVRNYKDIATQISGEDDLIEVVYAMDSICAPCPHNLDGRMCASQEHISQLDAKHLNALGLKVGEKIRWRDAKALIKYKVQPADLKTLCAGCEWYEYGFCTSSLERLHKV